MLSGTCRKTQKGGGGGGGGDGGTFGVLEPPNFDLEACITKPSLLGVRTKMLTLTEWNLGPSCIKHLEICYGAY